MLASKIITEIIENHSEFSGFPKSCNKFVSSRCTHCSTQGRPFKPIQLHWARRIWDRARRIWGPAPWCLGRLFIFCQMHLATDLCEVLIISIIIPFRFLLYSLNQPDCRIESCAERVNPSGLRVPGQVRESELLCMSGGRRMGNSLCRQLNVEPKHVNLISSKIAKRVDVLY